MKRPPPELSEEAAIRALRGLARRWPSSLWLFSAAGTLHVMRTKDGDGARAHVPTGGVDPNYSIDTIDIPNDGGDW